MLVLGVIGLAFIAIAGLIHIYIYVLESVAWRGRGAPTFGIKGADVETVRPWAFNQGWYNLFLAVGTIGGAVLGAVGTLAPDSLPATVTSGAIGIAAFCALSMVGAALVLISTSREQLRGALVQGTAPLIGLVCLVVALSVR